MPVVGTSQSVIARKCGQAYRCHRCGGFMVQEKVFEIGSFDWHCISCGDRIDPVILAHRQVPRPTDFACEETEKLFAGHGKRRLN